MNLDYAYCSSQKCIHRRKCKRYIDNYTEQEQEEILKSARQKWILASDCIEGSPPYKLLDRIKGDNDE